MFQYGLVFEGLFSYFSHSLASLLNIINLNLVVSYCGAFLVLNEQVMYRH